MKLKHLLQALSVPLALAAGLGRAETGCWHYEAHAYEGRVLSVRTLTAADIPASARVDAAGVTDSLAEAPMVLVEVAVERRRRLAWCESLGDCSPAPRAWATFERDARFLAHGLVSNWEDRIDGRTTFFAPRACCREVPSSRPACALNLPVIVNPPDDQRVQAPVEVDPEPSPSLAKAPAPQAEPADTKHAKARDRASGAAGRLRLEPRLSPTPHAARSVPAPEDTPSSPDPEPAPTLPFPSAAANGDLYFLRAAARLLVSRDGRSLVGALAILVRSPEFELLKGDGDMGPPIASARAHGDQVFALFYREGSAQAVFFRGGRLTAFSPDGGRHREPANSPAGAEDAELHFEPGALAADDGTPVRAYKLRPVP